MFDTLVYVLLILIWPLCLFIVGLVLLQGGAGDMSSAFGGGGQLDSTLGVGAGRKMSKLTGWMVFAFLAIVTILAIPHSRLDVRAKASAKHSASGTTPAAVEAGKPGEKVSSPEVKPQGEAAPANVTVTPEAPPGATPAPAAEPAQAPAPATAPAPAPPAEPAPAPHSKLE